MRGKRFDRFLRMSVLAALTCAGLWYALPLLFDDIYQARAVARPSLDTQQAQPTARIRVVGPAGAVGIGNSFSVTITAEQLSRPLSAFQFDLSYNPNQVELVSVTPGSFLGATGRDSVCPEPSRRQALIRVACASTGNATGATGGGPLAVITFRALKASVSTMALGNVLLPDTGRPPKLAQAAILNAQVSIRQPLFLPLIRK
jgi:hypothetical protein